MKDVMAMVVESAKSLATWIGDVSVFDVFYMHVPCYHSLPPLPSLPLLLNWTWKALIGSYLRDTSNVLVAVLLREAEILVQAESHIVAVQTVGGNTKVEEMLLQGSGHSGLARGRQPGEPESEAALATGLVALTAGEGRVPGDVAVRR